MSMNLLMRAGILQRIVALNLVRLALMDSREDLHRRLLRALAITDEKLAEATAELGRYPEDEPACSEDGGYEDRDPLVNAVKGDLG